MDVFVSSTWIPGGYGISTETTALVVLHNLGPYSSMMSRTNLMVWQSLVLLVF